ncbi:MAG: iron-containing alcohol dehydrogenase [Lachnospiraceae bacterium]
MNQFTFSVPQNIIVGKGSLQRLPELAGKLGGNHAFLISDPHLYQIGIVETCVKALEAENIVVDTFTETERNPSVETVHKAADLFQQCGADFLIALGGGSPMDVAKAVGVVAKYGGNITEYEGGGKVPGEIIPLIAVPTTAGTGSEVTAFAVITDHSRNYKLTVFSYKLIPSYAILDPELITTAPPSVAAACGIDAMIHALEAYISTAASPFTDAMAEKALELIGKNIRRYVANRTDREAAEAMMTGSLMAGIAFSWARLGNVHAMSHPVSAYFDVPHGVANAILLPTVVEYNSLADKGKYLTIYNYISERPVAAEEFVPSMLAEKIRELNRSLGIPATLREVGVTEDKFEKMTDDAMNSGNITVNPRASVWKDIYELYRRAY